MSNPWLFLNVAQRSEFLIDRMASTDNINWNDWINQMARQCHITDPAPLKLACELAQVGLHVPSIYHPSCFRLGLESAAILAELGSDIHTLCAAILVHAVQYAKLSLAALEHQFDKKTLKMIESASQIAVIDHLSQLTPSPKQSVDKLRRMMLAMVEDMGAVFIKLAERVVIMHHLSLLDSHLKSDIAQQTLAIYAPLAHRLGIATLKWQLEDSSFAYLHPDDYQHITTLLAEDRVDRERRIHAFTASLQTQLIQAAIHADISGRAKHVYSIFCKMRKKNIPYEEIYDMSAVRIVVNCLEDCYAALGIVHAHWDYLPSEFNDYISKPKANGYQSIHTVIRDTNQQLIEVQIRTHSMHQAAEYGVAAHWKYKEGTTTQNLYEEKINRLRQLLAWHRELTAVDAAQLNPHIFEDQIYVFTPEGDITGLPKGATPLDFAYAIHTELGHRCRGAQVDGKMVPLTYQLRTGERVTIIKARESKPSRDWLNTESGYLKTARARTKVQHWFKKEHNELMVADGKLLLDRELAKHTVNQVPLEKIANALHYKTTEQLYSALGGGHLRVGQVIHAVAKLYPKSMVKPSATVAPAKIRLQSQRSSQFSVQGVDNLLTRVAGCCKPIPGDDIVGYITVGRGVAIHRSNCRRLTRTVFSKQNRIVEVKWNI